MEQLNSLLATTNPPVFGDHVLEQIIANAPVAISITDKHGNILYVNQTFSDITGYLSHELIGQNSSLLSYHSTPKSVYQNLWHTITSGHHWHGQLLNRRKNGEAYIAEISVSPFENPTDDVYYYAIHKDITETHQLQVDQKNQSAMFQSVLNAAPIAIALIDKHQHILLHNARFQRISDSLGRSPIDLLSDNLRHEYNCDSIQTYMGKQTQRLTELYLEEHHNGSERWFDYVLIKIPVSDTTAATYFTPEADDYTVVAISERTREKLLVEERRINTIKLMAQDNKHVHTMQEALMATLHQLQGPFNMIGSAINILKQTNASCPGLVAMDEAMHNAVQAMADIKQAIPERSNEAFQPVNLNQVIRDATSICTDELLMSSIHLELHLNHKLPTIIGMPHRLVLAIKQLLDNALDAIQQTKSAERIVSISSSELQGEVRIDVEDSGIGIDPSIRLKIFQPFYSTKPKHYIGCRGIGLSIVQQVLNEHSAMMAIEESPRLGGTKISLTFTQHEW
jgi:nitrogen fixation negative regulator NifL